LSPCFSDFSAFCSGGLVDIIADWVRDCAVAYSTEIALATGTAAAIEGFYSVFFSSPRVESRSFGVLHLVRALSNSAPHLYFLLVVMIREGIYMLEAQIHLGLGPTIAAAKCDLRIVLLSAICSFLCLISALLNFVTSPVTDAPSAVRRSMLSGARGETVAIALVVFFVSDIVLRTLAIMCFAYGLSDRGWVAIIVISIIALCSWSTKYLYDPAAKVTIKAYGGKAIFFDVVEAFSAVMAPRLLFGVDASTRFSGNISVTVSCVALLTASLAFAEGNLRDGDFQRQIATICSAAVVGKLGTFFWCVYPALTRKYEILHWLTKDTHEAGPTTASPSAAGAEML